MQIKIEGFRIDRLLDKAMKGGLDLRSIKMISQIEVLCWITPYDLKKLKKTAGALYKITEISHYGPEYRIKKFLKAPIKIIGAILILAIVISQSFFVKTIEVNGYKGIPETELRQCLAESGIKEGTYIPKIDWAEAESHIYDVFPQITWVQLVYEGRKIFLNISESGNDLSTEELLPSSASKDRSYSNIVANQSGYIETISAYRGMILAEKGDYVEKGQVLISGYVPIQATVFEEGWPTEYFVKSKGEIWARVPYRLTFNQERYAKGAGAKEGIVENKHEKSEKQIKEKVNQQIRQWAKENLPENAQILNKDLNFSYKENIIEVSVTLEVRRQIGEEQEILIGQENSDSSGD